MMNQDDIGYFIDADGNYYEGHNKGADEEVDRRPDTYHKRVDGTWEFDIDLALTIGGKVVKQALQTAINDRAKLEGFSDGNSFMLYAGFTNPFKAAALKFAQWEASVWQKADDYKAEVIAGTQPMASPEEAVAMMPAYPA